MYEFAAYGVTFAVYSYMHKRWVFSRAKNLQKSALNGKIGLLTLFLLCDISGTINKAGIGNPRSAKAKGGSP